MPALDNQRWELFAQGLASGLSATAAYIKAGYKEAGAAPSAGRLLRNAQISARIAQIKAEVNQAAIGVQIADRSNRIMWLDDRLARMRQVIEERAKAREVQDAPGGRTGLVVKQIKGIGRGEDFERVEEYAVDTALLKEMRAHEQQAAQELGQWNENREAIERSAAGIPAFIVQVTPAQEKSST